MSYRLIEHGIFGDEPQILTNQKLESTVFSLEKDTTIQQVRIQQYNNIQDTRSGLSLIKLLN